MPSALRIKEIRDLEDNVMMSNGALTDNVSFPAGHIVQQDSNVWHWTGDNGCGSSQSSVISAFGPVISMKLKNANAQIRYSVYMSRSTNTGSTPGEYYLIGGTTPFSSSGFKTDHNASILPPTNVANSSKDIIGIHAPGWNLQVTLDGICQCSNNEDETYYFSTGARIDSNYLYYNYDGNYGMMTLTLAEIQV